MNTAKDAAIRILELQSCTNAMEVMPEDEVYEVCTRLLELEEEQRVTKSAYQIVLDQCRDTVYERDALKAELKAANERYGKLEVALTYIAQNYGSAKYVPLEGNECAQAAYEALKITIDTPLN